MDVLSLNTARKTLRKITKNCMCSVVTLGIMIIWNVELGATERKGKNIV